MVDATQGRFIEVTVTGPLGEPLNACFGLLGNGNTAMIEMAQASGIELVRPEARNPLIATTFGTGELIKAALDLGVRHFIVGIGGSATNDGGAGMLQALGIKLLDDNNQELEHGGAALAKLSHIDLATMDERLKQCTFIAASDVNNPLTGVNGASATFGPQKGATPEMVALLDNALRHYAAIIKRDLGIEVDAVAGAGAAGGMGAALLGFLNAKLKPGIEMVMEAAELAEKVKGADLVITGEGRIDGQTAQGKTPVGVARIAKMESIPVIALAGSVGPGVEAVYEKGIDALFPVVHGAVSLDEALAKGSENLTRAARNLAATLKLAL